MRRKESLVSIREITQQTQSSSAAPQPSEVFIKLRNYLAGSHIGATRDSALFDQVVLCLFAKLYLTHLPQKQRKSNISHSIKEEYEQRLSELRRKLGRDCLPDTPLKLSTTSLAFVDHTLSLLDWSAHRDLVGDAYQCFRGSDSRGQEGQFFTPATAIGVLVSIVDPKPGEKIIDPACGAGGFLLAATKHLLDNGMPGKSINKCIFGIDKDAYLARLAKMRVSLLTLQNTNVSVGDSLSWQAKGSKSFMHLMKPGHFDVVLTNPPFGTKITAASEALRKSFALAYRWKLVADNNLVKTEDLLPSSPPQVLFIERCISLVKPGGRIGMVVPESLLSSKNYRHVVEYILKNTDIEAVIGMPEALFKTSGRGGTHTKTVLLVMKKTSGLRTRGRKIFLAEASWCGHDSRGRLVPKDDTDVILKNYRRWKEYPQSLNPSVLGSIIDRDKIIDNILAPRAYDFEMPAILKSLETTHELISFQELVRRGIVAVTTGDEVGKLAYGTGEVPFVRTSDLSTWEIKLDPKHGLSREVYESLKEKQDVQPGDILMVRDGTYLIGTCAIVTKFDTEIVLQSHLYKIRVHDNDLLDAYLLLAILSCPIVQRQIKAHTQTQDIINSLGPRINNLILPIPKDKGRRLYLSQTVHAVIKERTDARELARRVLDQIAVPSSTH